MPKKVTRISDHCARWLTPEELVRLKTEMEQASAWMRSELKRRRANRGHNETTETPLPEDASCPVYAPDDDPTV